MSKSRGKKDQFHANIKGLNYKNVTIQPQAGGFSLKEIASSTDNPFFCELEM